MQVRLPRPSSISLQSFPPVKRSGVLVLDFVKIGVDNLFGNVTSSACGVCLIQGWRIYPVKVMCSISRHDGELLHLSNNCTIIKSIEKDPTARPFLNLQNADANARLNIHTTMPLPSRSPIDVALSRVDCSIDLYILNCLQYFVDDLTKYLTSTESPSSTLSGTRLLGSQFLSSSRDSFLRSDYGVGELSKKENKFSLTINDCM
jgi:hypothetical protein